MQHSHAHSTGWYRPPPHVSKQLIAQAVRNIPNNHLLMNKCYPKHDALKQLPTHKYNDTGKLQWAFMN